MRRAAIVVALGALLAAGVALAQSADGSSIGEERERLATANSALQIAQTRAARAEAVAAAARSDADVTRTQIVAIESRIRSAEARVVAAQARLRLIDAVRRRQRERLAAQQGGIVRLAAGLQTMARRPPALALAEPGSLDDLVHLRALLETTLPAVRARTAGLRAEITRVTELGTAIDRATAALHDSQVALARERLSLIDLEGQQRSRAGTLEGSAREQAERALALGERARDIVDAMQEMGSAQDIGARLASLALPPQRPGSRLQEGASPRSTPRYLLPVKGPVAIGFGAVTDAGVSARGITFLPKPDAKVVSPAPGRVLFAGTFRSYGGVLIIDHGGGWTTTVTGLASLAVQAGKAVDQGDTLGRVAGERPRVTVELRRAGRAIDLSAMILAG